MTVLLTLGIVVPSVITHYTSFLVSVVRGKSGRRPDPAVSPFRPTLPGRFSPRLPAPLRSHDGLTRRIFACWHATADTLAYFRIF